MSEFCDVTIRWICCGEKRQQTGMRLATGNTAPSLITTQRLRPPRAIHTESTRRGCKARIHCNARLGKVTMTYMREWPRASGARVCVRVMCYLSTHLYMPATHLLRLLERFVALQHVSDFVEFVAVLEHSLQALLRSGHQRASDAAAAASRSHARARTATRPAACSAAHSRGGNCGRCRSGRARA